MLVLNRKEECCGCSACMSVCPKHCIEMKDDVEGFKYPLIDESRCCKCNRCEQVCPIIHGNKEIKKEQKAFLAQNKDEIIRLQSTSGGVFSALATSIIEEGGVVFGASMDDSYVVNHVCVSSENDLVKFRNSKYVQSNINNCFIQAKEYLNNGVKVLFSGTPCQIEGLKNYLKVESANLYCVDVVCRAVPSPLVLKKYVDWHFNKFDGQIASLRFRDKKKYGYRFTQMEVVYKEPNIDTYYAGKESDPYLRAFFENYCDRPSCHECNFRKQYRVSDITLWDAQDCGKICKKLDDNKGTSKVLIHSKQGNQLWKKAESKMIYYELLPDIVVDGVFEMKSSIAPNTRRGEFMDALNMFEGNELFDNFFPNSRIILFKKNAKVFLSKMGIYNVVKRLVKR